MVIAAGIRFPSLGTHAGIPSGFVRATDLDDRSPLGSGDAGGTNGGASTHAHNTTHGHVVAAHTHTGATSGNSSGNNGGTNTTGSNAANATHNHTIPTSGSIASTLGTATVTTTTTGSSLPLSSEVIWIESNGSPTGIPNGAWAFWAGAAAPASWVVEAGPAGLYLVGATTGANSGGTRGSATHSHAGQAHTHGWVTHQHSLANTGTASATTSIQVTGATTFASSGHAHAATITDTITTPANSGSATSGATGSIAVAPPYRKLAIIRNNTGAAELPIGTIGMFDGTVAAMPGLWILCDGSNGTPDMRDRLVVASASDLSDVGLAGGGDHDHTDPTGHTHDANHTHTLAVGAIDVGASQRVLANATGSPQAHTHTGATSGSGGGTSDSVSEAIEAGPALPPNRTQVFIQYRPDVLPAIPVADTEASAVQVADALAGLHGGVDLRFSYTRRTRTNEYIDDISAAVVTAGKISLDNTRGVLRDLTITVDRELAPGDFAPSIDIIGVAVEVYVPEVGQFVSMPAGLYTLDVSETHYRGAGSVLVPCRGADLVMLLVRSLTTAPYRVLVGTTYEDAVRTILDAHGLAHSIPTTGYTLPFNVSWPARTTYWQIVYDLLLGANHHGPEADVNGVVRTYERLDPSTVGAAVVYQDTAEPKMVSEPDEYVTKVDRKIPNRVSIGVELRLGDVQVEAENVDVTSPNSTGALAFGTQSVVVSSSVDAATLVTTEAAHGLGTGVPVLIRDHLGAVPDINGSHEVTVVSPTTFTIPVAVTTPGAGGTAQPTTVQPIEFKPDGSPSTRAVASVEVAREIARYQARWAAVLAQPADLATFLDPRRGAHENYALDIDGIEEAQLYAVIGWTMELAHGAIMQHQIGRANPVEVLDVAPWGVE